ncbi:MAG: DUF1636 domain-containing protein [Pseudomonadota bacterium]
MSSSDASPQAVSRGVPATTTVVVCETCGYDPEQPDDVRPGKRLGDALAEALQMRRQAAEQVGDAEAATALAGLRVRPFRCLMACKRGCTAQFRAAGKVGYTVGDMQPDQASIETLLAYGLRYQASLTGEVPFKQWPSGIRGRFVARFPVLPSPDIDE